MSARAGLRKLALGAPALGLLAGSVARADHVPPVGLDYAGTWVVLIAVGVVFTLLILAFVWAYLDGQFADAESIKHELTEPEREWPYGRGTTLERPEV